MSVFTQKLNSLTGKTVWEIQSENYDYEQEIARSSFADMLHDEERNQMYFDALKIAISKTHLLGKKANVLDIGTGTGLLSMMAVQCGADSVYACEAFTPMSECAQKVITLNNFKNKIKVISKHSTSLTVGKNGDLPEKANILVTEVFDTELIGEGAIETFKHAHQNLLEEDCIVIPDSASIYIQIVETPLAHNWNSIKNIYDVEGELLIRAPSSIKNCNGAAAVHDIQLSQISVLSFKELISPQPVLHFDWSNKNKLKYDRRSVLKAKVKQTGCAQLVFMWWELHMDEAHKIVLSCAPYWAHPARKLSDNLTDHKIPWRDHWMQAVYYLPFETHLQKEAEVNLISCHDQFSLWFYVDKILQPLDSYNKPICQCGLHIVHSRTRIGQLNDGTRNKKYLSFIEESVNSDSVVLLMGDGFYLGLAAARKGAKKVLYLNDGNLTTTILQEFIDCNHLDNVEIIKDIQTLKQNYLISSVSLVLAEPHFTTTILPWDGLHFAYLINELKTLLPSDCVIAPFGFTIKCAPVEFIDLQKIRQPLKQCFNLNMAPFDDLIMDASLKCDEVVEPQPLWEYPCIFQGSVLELLNIDLVTIFQKNKINVSKELKIENPTRCNGVALWVDWYLDRSKKGVISTGPIQTPNIGEIIQWDMHTRQGVHFLLKPCEQLKCEFSLSILEASYKFKFI